MINDDGSPNTAHSKSPVPCILVSPDRHAFQIKNGKLGDIAPTLLKLMKVDIPNEMTGEILISRQ
jgi:2,3-bisphosphoglycerate-independent phosphoglycerate mutase